MTSTKIVNRRSFLGYIRYDLKTGFLQQWKQYIPIALLFTLLCFQLYTKHQEAVPYLQKQSPSELSLKLSYGDYIFYIFQGMPVFRFEDKEFKINIIWLVINIYLAYLVSFYPFKDLKSYGKLIILYSQKRNYWWLSKCIWNIFSVLAFYFLAYIICGLFAIFNGELNLLPNGHIQAYFNHIESFSITGEQMFNYMFLAILISISVSLMQMLISLITQPIIGLISIAAIMVFSIFFCEPYVIGNYVMFIRNENIVNGNGINLLNGGYLSILIIIFSIFIGLKLFQKKDIL